MDFFSFAAAHPVTAIVIMVLFLLCGGLVTFIIVLNSPEKAQLVASWMLGAVSWISKRARRKQIEYNVEGHVNLGVQRIQSVSFGGLELPRVKVEWVNTDTAHDLRENTLILRLRRSNSDAQNITNVAIAVARDGVIRDAGSYVDDDIERGLEVAVTRELIGEMGHQYALRHFTNDVVRQLAEDPEVAGALSRIEVVQEAGLIARCMLIELAHLTAQLYPHRIKEKAVLQETREFLAFLHNYASRSAGKDSESGLDFYYPHIAIGMVIVAKHGKLAAQGLVPYVRRVLTCFGSGAEAVYVSAFDRTMDAANDVAGKVVNTADREGNRVFRMDGQRRFRGTYAGEVHEVLLIRISRLRAVDREDLEAASAAMG